MEPSDYLNPAEEKMELAVAYLDEALAHIRAGKANPKILDGIRVEYYGSAMPVSQVANVAVPDARTITITPWEKAMFKEIEKAIINSELGITPENNGEVIRLSIPPLTEERRKNLVKQSKAEAETAKVSVRNARRDAIDGLIPSAAVVAFSATTEFRCNSPLSSTFFICLEMVDLLR